MILLLMERSSPVGKCPIQISLSVIGGKWKPIILWFLKDGPVRFSGIQRKIPGITQMMLTKQLRELVADRMIERTVYPEVPPRVDYSITDDGLSVFPVLVALNEWGNEYQRRKYGSWSQKCVDTFHDDVRE
jgi:DNA-binding HxlR family transcriptional regulator